LILAQCARPQLSFPQECVFRLLITTHLGECDRLVVLGVGVHRSEPERLFVGGKLLHVLSQSV
jgi:hypothetical protein